MAEARRRVLIVTREAPPSIGPHPIRVAKLAKYLPVFGWRPTILTVPEDHAWARDPRLLEDLGGADLVRVPRLLTGVSHPTSDRARHAGGPDGTAGRELRLRRGLGRYLVPDAAISWAIPAAPRAAALARESDAILTTAPPFSTHLVGLWATGRTGTPWVAEYRDNWTVNPLYRRNAPVHALDRWLERRVLASARLVVVVSEAAAAELGRAFPVVRGRIRVARNGYDPDDIPPPGGPAKTFTIAYLGSLDERRDPRPFFAALVSAGADEPGLANDVRLHLMGNVAGWVATAAAETVGPERVVTEGLLPHRDALARGADAAVLLGITTMAEAGAAGTTSKLFEYLGLKRPILMLAPEGPAASIVSELGAGQVAAPDDPAAIATALRSLYRDWREGRASVASDDALLAFTRLETARRVAAALDEVVATRRG